MLKKILKSVVLSSILLGTNIYANNDMVTNENVVDINQDADQNTISSANMDLDYKDDSISSWISDFEEAQGVKIGEVSNGRTFFSGTAPVRVNPMDPAYAKELTIAYEKALLNLQANFILQNYGTMTTQRILDFVEDDSTNANIFEPIQLKKDIEQGQLSRILDKTLSVIENKLDAQLAEQGLSSSEIKKMSITQKKEIFKDNFKKSMIKKAVQNISGLVPVQTKVVSRKTKVGDAVEIGIIAVMSQKTRQFADDMARQRATNVKGTPKDLNNVLPKNDKEYLNEFGLRYLYDKDGKPMLLSYGRWSVVGKSQNPSKYLRKIESAKEKARMFAEASIGEFMKSNIQASQSADIESISEEIATKVTEFENNVQSGSNEGLDEIGETIDRSFKKIKATSTFKLRGTSQLKTWETEDQNGVLHVGSVVTWTYSQLDNANSIANINNKKTEVKQEKKEIAPESKKSKMVNDANDF